MFRFAYEHENDPLHETYSALVIFFTDSLKIINLIMYYVIKKNKKLIFRRCFQKNKKNYKET